MDLDMQDFDVDEGIGGGAGDQVHLDNSSTH